MKIMLLRVLRCRIILITIFIATGLCVYLCPQFKLYPIAPVTVAPSPSHPRTSRHISKLLTVVFRQFEDFENDVADSVQSFVSAFPNVPVVVVSETTPYPPFPFSASNETLRNVKVVTLELRLNAAPKELDPLTYIHTDYVLFVPDSTRVSRRVLQQAAIAATAPSAPAVAIGVASARLICQHIKWNYADWTLQYNKDASGKICDAVHGQHALLIKTAYLHSFPQPFALPFPESLYLQMSAKDLKVQILEGKLGGGRGVLKSPSARQKSIRHMRDTRVALYKMLGVKAMIREDGRVQWFGCKRETQRCFPSVQGTPSYILSHRNTPPCCRRNMRRSAAHVLRALAQAGARCWLETTSLLGAVVRGDLLPWAEHVEIGIHESDVPRVPWLQRGGADPEGYVWERATKGHYYRVAYSATNNVYVLVLPFSAKNGTMWPADWVLAHQKPFPERHLHPLAQIQFAGRQAPAPNDASAFLDLKLGAAAVERCNRIGPKLLYP
ncbi:ribitol 5-phosphate transferase FKRP [Cydia splendana]|uniref:ribitol 5-phosphate transferase FKRP n=1 Tax=Cydia splendana TaxID=1100963 RepID=UPI0028F4B06C